MKRLENRAECILVHGFVAIFQPDFDNFVHFS